MKRPHTKTTRTSYARGYYHPRTQRKPVKSEQPIIPALLSIALAFVLLAMVSSAKACDDVYVGAWSYHIDDNRDLNETHYLLACERSGYIVGGMKNSHGDPAALLGKKIQLFESGYFESAVYLGATYGYYGCDNNDSGSERSLCPMVAPEISYTKYRVKPALVLLGNAMAVTFKVGF